MDTDQTRFREALVEDLKPIIREDAYREFCKRNSFIEDPKEELWCHFVDYYEKALLQQSSFRKEFSEGELRKLESVQQQLCSLTPNDWPEIQKLARELYSLVMSEDD